MKPVRCAIYTRKSSDEGLEQSFNSLDAQREACAAYILSQASEGWSALPDVYDDGGLSGGTLERPALQRLLGEVAAGRVDIIVVYKVDRLTRSLLDFSRLVEAFDKAGTSFVSVTQSFNTTTSMGRLTLNMLLSFAQFEREVTAERIRDKLAASKAKGMWMGGTPPIGYAPNGRSLDIIPEHAAVVRDIFTRYLDRPNVRIVAEQLCHDGVVAPVRSTVGGKKTFGGGPFSRGQLYAMLSCPLYVGEIHHRGNIYPALHQPIITRDIWDRVQATLAGNMKGVRTRTPRVSVLAGKVVDAAGVPLVATHANKPAPGGTEGKLRYRYYVSRILQTEASAVGMRIPAAELEGAVCQRLATLFADGLDLAAATSLATEPATLDRLFARCAAVHADVTRRHPEVVTALLRQVRIQDRRIDIDCDVAAIATAVAAERLPTSPNTLTLTADVRLSRSGMRVKLIHSDGAAVERQRDPTLIRLLLKARRWWAILRQGELTVDALARQEGVSPAYLTRVVRLAFLSPAVLDALLAGRMRAGVDGAALTATGGVPALWAEQVRVMLPTGDR